MRGLVNLGNTCFFNTAVQCLAHVPPLTVYFYGPDYIGDCEITKEYQKVIKQLFKKDETSPVDAVGLFTAFGNQFERFKDGNQHDAQEVVLLLIDVFEKSLGKELVMDFFNGEQTQETVYQGNKSTKTEKFTTFFAIVNKPTTLKELIEESEKITHIENYIDDSGKTHENAYVRNRVTRWPKFINFTFSMYEHKFPIQIPADFEGRRLFACILHRGHMHGGHYALLVRRHNKWYIKDDERVTELPDINEVRGDFYQAWYRPVNSLS
jgi:ubiquitin C-terminal hydrolase